MVGAAAAGVEAERGRTMIAELPRLVLPERDERADPMPLLILLAQIARRHAAE